MPVTKIPSFLPDAGSKKKGEPELPEMHAFSFVERIEAAAEQEPRELIYIAGRVEDALAAFRMEPANKTFPVQYIEDMGVARIVPAAPES